ncbi:Cytochrome c, mono-and diheme variants [Saccharicrinis carchari]|uniref:Cytochrome c, mono-and diheme variants n=1 Tax=Saccharicrinis carchari TaxID=1168039 RepID=A0A521BAA4_SACCC|nr:c-type cytochrome [Saccharicrinis carchari]SMO43630.1 Cytochrome c, mono-and diheme variants [Saccharicrinis carchari]
MKKGKLIFLTYPLAAALAILFLMAFAASQDKKFGPEWDIPAKYKTMENPYAGDASLDRVGRMLYSKHCKSCHGGIGLGDGSKAASLNVAMYSFAGDKFQAQSDGVIYYQSFIGRDEMPNFEKKIPDEEDRWALVNYLRSFKK